MSELERAAYVSGDGRYRWVLTRRWGAGPLVCWIMLNPSTADASVDDPTIRDIMARSEGWGYGQLVVVNLYPVRSSNPKQAKQWAAENCGSVELQANLGAAIYESRTADLVVAAWGAAPWAAARGEIVLGALAQRGLDVHTIGTTKNGAPKHPLARGTHRVPRGQRPLVWRARP